MQLLLCGVGVIGVAPATAADAADTPTDDDDDLRACWFIANPVKVKFVSGWRRIVGRVLEVLHPPTRCQPFTEMGSIFMAIFLPRPQSVSEWIRLIRSQTL